MRNLWLKFIQLMQFKFLQQFYLSLLKVILWLMNYGIGWSTFWNWEIKTLNLVDSYLRKIKNPIIFDVWANIWQYINDINDNIMTASTIYCFEPQSHTFQQLLKNIPFNTLHTIHPINIWFGDIEWVLDIYSELDPKDDIDNSCASIISENITNFLSKDLNKESIVINTIDNFCEFNSIDNINFLKIDIEGYEIHCLKWAKKIIENGNIEIIQVEHNRCAIASKVFLRDYWDMFSDKYVICRPLSNNKWRYRIEYYDIYMENFTYINYVFIKKDIYNTYFI